MGEAGFHSQKRVGREVGSSIRDGTGNLHEGIFFLYQVTVCKKHPTSSGVSFFSYCTAFGGVFPSKNAMRFCAASVAIPSRVGTEAEAMWGVMTTFSQTASPGASSGSFSYT